MRKWIGIYGLSSVLCYVNNILIESNYDFAVDEWQTIFSSMQILSKLCAFVNCSIKRWQHSVGCLSQCLRRESMRKSWNISNVLKKFACIVFIRLLFFDSLHLRWSKWRTSLQWAITKQFIQLWFENIDYNSYCLMQRIMSKCTENMATSSSECCSLKPSVWNDADHVQCYLLYNAHPQWRKHSLAFLSLQSRIYQTELGHYVDSKFDVIENVFQLTTPSDVFLISSMFFFYEYFMEKNTRNKWTRQLLFNL